MPTTIDTEAEEIFFATLFAMQVDPSLLDIAPSHIDGPEGALTPKLKVGAEVRITREDVPLYLIAPFVVGADSEQQAYERAARYLFAKCPPLEGWFQHRIFVVPIAEASTIDSSIIESDLPI